MTENVLTFGRTTAAPREARQRVRAQIAARERVEDAILLVSELVTNAVKYAPEEGEIRLILGHDGDTMRVTVHDPGLGPLPEMRAEDDPEPGGHGLRLVDAVADRWGVERGSTRVWFELDS